MPLYDYCCVDCKQAEERNVKIDDREDQYCVKCDGHLIREISFKGSVWAPTAGGMR
jgi:putative FmdB family regulatory protein